MYTHNSKEVKETTTYLTCYGAEQEIKIFIEELKEDVEVLKGESFQRHDPEYYDEVDFYNNFHQGIPRALLLSSCYIEFNRLYREEGKSLYEAVSAFIKEYEAVGINPVTIELN